jgi:hypothetical protein
MRTYGDGERKLYLEISAPTAPLIKKSLFLEFKLLQDNGNCVYYLL